MARVYRELLARGWEDVRLIACVHDELVLEAPEVLAAEAAALLKECLGRAGAEVLAPVPVGVGVAVGETWAEK
jgi:DNA polymerase I-like protein with 3'-5' exonuclease and polymerase domains